MPPSTRLPPELQQHKHGFLHVAWNRGDDFVLIARQPTLAATIKTIIKDFEREDASAKNCKLVLAATEDSIRIGESAFASLPKQPVPRVRLLREPT
jgi:hypothetical protein